MSIIVIAGRFSRDAEGRHLPDGTAVAGFSIAENIYNGKEQQAQFWECSLFGKRAESLAPYIKKGGAATVYGEPRQRKYTGKDGIERTVTDIRVSDITLQGGKQHSDHAEPSAPTRRENAAQKAAQKAETFGRISIDDDIPW